MNELHNNRVVLNVRLDTLHIYCCITLYGRLFCTTNGCLFCTTDVKTIFAVLQLLQDYGSFLDHLGNWELVMWSMVLGVYLLRFITLGTKINKKYRNFSVLITEQVRLIIIVIIIIIIVLVERYLSA